MALGVNALIDFAFSYTSPTAYDFQAPDASFRWSRSFSMTTGTGANQGDLVWADQRTINASTNDDLDLAGVLTNVFGGTLTFARVKGILVYSQPANTQTFTIGGGSNPFNTWVTGTTPAVVVRPGGFFGLTAPDATGYAVTSGTGDILRIANGAGSQIAYDIVIFGASA